MAIDVTPLTPVLGAEVSGVTLEPGMSEADVTAIRAALLEHKVLFFRGQRLDAAEMTKVASKFGEPTPAHPVEPAVEGHPEVLALDSEEGARADVWHSDLTYQERPPLGAMLHGETIPEVGGDTVWVDMCAAYEALSPSLRGFLETLTATHSSAKADGFFATRDTTGGVAAMANAAAAPSHHPVVRVHPETGKRSVFVNPLFTIKIDGLRRAESDAILAVIQEVATRPDGMLRWKWQAGDVAFWDNRCTMHYALRDFGDARRNMLRVALEGDKPVGVSV
ncbi:MAG: TauD/TfdA family dioxygenase [Acidimicrobiales bacterium]|nr:TauD/TfdA family dioxygenase [Acidimicrobiales bacterium]